MREFCSERHFDKRVLISEVKLALWLQGNRPATPYPDKVDSKEEERRDTAATEEEGRRACYGPTDRLSGWPGNWRCLEELSEEAFGARSVSNPLPPLSFSVAGMSASPSTPGQPALPAASYYPFAIASGMGNIGPEKKEHGGGEGSEVILSQIDLHTAEMAADVEDG